MTSQNRKRPRNIDCYNPAEQIYIFCEGEKTEPQYFQEFANAIRKNPIYKNSVSVAPIGVGKSTLCVVNDAQEYAEKNNIKGASIWCVYDKDDFPEDDFNSAEQKLTSLREKDKNKYYAAWSNQCVEYWFILHFDYYIANNHRTDYIKYLNDKFSDIGLDKYKKNNKELFDILLKYGNPKQAITWAKKRMESFSGCTPSKSAPATKVYELVLTLAEYLPSSIKDKFI